MDDHCDLRKAQLICKHLKRSIRLLNTKNVNAWLMSRTSRPMKATNVNKMRIGIGLGEIDVSYCAKAVMGIIAFVLSWLGYKQCDLYAVPCRLSEYSSLLTFNWKDYQYFFFNGSTASCWALASFSVSWSFLQTVGFLGRVISPSQGRYLNTGQHKHRINTYTHQTSMPCVGFEPMISAIRPVYWRVCRIYRKHRFFYCCVSDGVYRAVAW
jgi:hypothetical protein